MSRAEQRTLTALLAAVTLVAVLLLALLGGPTGGPFLVRSTALAAATDSHPRTLVDTALPFGQAFGAGMLAAFNPCGFGLVPAYLGLHLGSGRVRVAVRFGISAG